MAWTETKRRGLTERDDRASHPPAPAERGARGSWAEREARRFLEGQGLVFHRANFRTRRGEIDLVMEDGGTLVFVEVRYRAPGAPVGPAESIDARKRARLVAAAQAYLQRDPLASRRTCRFDVVGVRGGRARGAEPLEVEWIPRAFDA